MRLFKSKHVTVYMRKATAKQNIIGVVSIIILGLIIWAMVR